MIFSQRYKDLIDFSNGEFKDEICGDIDFTVKKKIAKALEDFREPQKYHPNRYDNYEETTDALEIATNKLNELVGYPIANLAAIDFNPMGDESMMLSSMFTPFLFDLIELQFETLSDSEKEPFRMAVNNVLRDNDVPWIITDGVMIKIDARQFEQDMKRKALEQLHELTDSTPVFQSAYDELIKAVEFLEKGNYAEAVTNAGKSYESLMKIICRVDKGNADKLTKQIIDDTHIDLPDGISAEGFRQNVLMALPYVRNNVGAHGSGMSTTELSRPLANLAVNLAAALDTYLFEEYSEEN
jgi:ketosteroid isomerase-like protein